MPLPKLLARTNRWLFNPLLRPLAGRVRPFASLTHTGRRSGKEYRIPIMAFPSGDGFVIALTYGAETDWVRNVLASGRCTLTYRGRTVPLEQPRLVQDAEGRGGLPLVVQLALRLIRVDKLLLLSRSVDQHSSATNRSAQNL